MKGIILCLLLIVCSSYVRASSVVYDCGIFSEFEQWKKTIYSLPSTSALKKAVDYKSYLKIAKSLALEDGLQSEETVNVYVVLTALNLVLKSAWVDNRIYKVESHREVCIPAEGRGELLIEYIDIYGNEKVKMIPFTNKSGQWKRSFYMTSGYSYILDRTVTKELIYGRF